MNNLKDLFRNTSRNLLEEHLAQEQRKKERASVLNFSIPELPNKELVFDEIEYQATTLLSGRDFTFRSNSARNRILIIGPQAGLEDLKKLQSLVFSTLYTVRKEAVNAFEGANWLYEYMDLCKLTHGAHGSALEINADKIAKMWAGVPSEHTNASAYRQQVNALRDKVVSENYADSGYLDDMATYLHDNWEFDSVENARRFVRNVVQATPFISNAKVSPDTKIMIEALIDKVRSRQTDEERSTLTPAVKKAIEIESTVRDIIEATMGPDPWEDVTETAVIGLSDNDLASCRPRNYQSMKTHRHDENYSSVSYKPFKGFEGSEISSIDVDLRLHPRNIARWDMSQSISPERSLVGTIIAFVMNANSIIVEDKLTKGLMDLTDDALVDDLETMCDKIIAVAECAKQDPRELTVSAKRKLTH